MKVYTGRGDDGTTNLLHGGRVGKDDLRTEAYGTVDEAVSALGLARSALHGEENARWHEAVLATQRELFVLGAQLATRADRWGELTEEVSRVSPAMVERIERAIDEVTETHPLPREFVVPGGTQAGAGLDLARTVVRRAERLLVRMDREGLLPESTVVSYCNRLSDYLFVLARALEGGAFVSSRPDA